MKVACIDIEGVLLPEMWPILAQKTRLSSLAQTTREEPDYKKLVNNRINILNKNKLKLSDVIKETSELSVLPGALNFITQLQLSFHVILVSDAFYQMVIPFLNSLGDPELRCHYFNCDVDGFISSAEYSREHGKGDEISKLRKSGSVSEIIAVGDAFNDLEMINNADKGFLFCPSVETAKAAGNIQIVHSYKEILDYATKY